MSSRFQHDIPLLDPAADMAVATDEYAELAQEERRLRAAVSSSALGEAMCSGAMSRSSGGRRDMRELCEGYKERVSLLEQARALRLQATASHAVTMSAELRRMKKVLRRLGYISAEGVLNAKGRFSCELSTGDELVLTDMVFGGDFTGLSVEQAVALLSCFVHKEPSKEKGAPAVPSVRELRTLTGHRLSLYTYDTLLTFHARSGSAGGLPEAVFHCAPDREDQHRYATRSPTHPSGHPP